jgi:hypothetical protein
MIVMGITAKNYCRPHMGGMIPPKPLFWGYFDQQEIENLTENQPLISNEMTSIDRI